MAAYVLLDRDGTLIRHIPYLIKKEDVVFTQGLFETISVAKEIGYRFGLVTNQSVIGRQIASREQVNSVNEFILDTIREETGATFDFVKMCPHIPTDGCRCRKPKIGMIQDEIRSGDITLGESIMVGDQVSDVVFACNAGIIPILFDGSHYVESCSPKPRYTVGSMMELTALLKDLNS